MAMLLAKLALSGGRAAGAVKDIMNIFSLFIDVLIAPLMPYLYKAIGWIAKGLPIIMKWSQKIFDWVVEGIKWLFTDMPTMVGDWIKKIPGYLTNIGSWIWEKIQNFF